MHGTPSSTHCLIKAAHALLAGCVTGREGLLEGCGPPAAGLHFYCPVRHARMGMRMMTMAVHAVV
ncbi:hypothetical protein HaLaN_14561, partial [Haematococcus lacustris]